VKRARVFILLFLTTVGLILSHHLYIHRHLLKLPGSDWCNGVGYLPENRATKTIHASKVVAKPWRGEHHVYGIFQLDQEKVSPGQPVVLRVDGAAKYCTKANSVGQKFHDIEAPEGYYLSQHYIRTRTAMWLSFLGKRGKLKQPHSWTLTYTE
jgi:hypothetical protein